MLDIWKTIQWFCCACLLKTNYKFNFILLRISSYLVGGEQKKSLVLQIFCVGCLVRLNAWFVGLNCCTEAIAVVCVFHCSVDSFWVPIHIWALDIALGIPWFSSGQSSAVLVCGFKCKAVWLGTWLFTCLAGRSWIASIIIWIWCWCGTEWGSAEALVLVWHGFNHHSQQTGGKSNNLKKRCSGYWKSN